MTTLLLAFVACGSLMAQKVGHINSQEILVAMPAYKTAQTDFVTAQNTMQKDLEDFQAELQSMVADYETNSATWTETKRALKEQEIRDKQGRLEGTAAEMERELGEKQQSLMKPLLDDIQKAIDEVAKENSFAYVLDLTTGTVVYWAGGEDVGPLVRKKLGIPAAAANPE